MGLKVGELFAELGLDSSKFNSELDRSEGRLGGFVGSVGKAAAAATAAGVVAVGALAVKGLTEFASFDKGMREVFTLMPGVSEDAMGQMSDDVLALSRDIGRLPEEVIPSLYDSLSAGVPAGNVFDFLGDADRLAVAGVSELSESVDLLTGTVNAYGGDVEVAARASDVWFATVQQGKTTIPELSSALGKVLPTAATFGVTIEDVGASMATLTKITGSTAESATGLNGLLGELGKAGTQASNAFEDAAGMGFQAFLEQGGNLGDALALLADQAESEGKSILDVFSSLEAGRAAAALTTGDGALLAENLAAIEGSAGAVDAAFETMDAGLSRSWDKIKATFATAVIEIGSRLAPMVEQWLEWLVDRLPDALDTLGEAWERGSEIIGGVVGFVQDVIERFGPIVEGVMGLFSDSVNETVDSVGDRMDDIRTLFEDVMADVEEILTLGVELFMALWERYGDQVLVIWETIQARIGPLVSALMTGLSQIIGGALDVIKGILNVFIGIFTGDWERMGAAVRQIWDGLWSIVSGIIGAAMETISALWDVGTEVLILGAELVRDLVVAAFELLRTGAENAWNALIDFLSDARDRIVGLFSDAGSWLFNAGKQIVQGLIDGIQAMWQSLKNKLSDLTGLLPDWKGPPAVDRRILRPSGEFIMEGLIAGIDSKMAAVRETLGSVGNAIASTSLPGLALEGAMAGAGGMGMGGPVSFEVDVDVTIEGNADEAAVERGVRRGIATGLIDAGISERVALDGAGLAI